MNEKNEDRIKFFKENQFKKETNSKQVIISKTKSFPERQKEEKKEKKEKE